MNGELEPCGDRWRVRFTRELPQPAEKVWRAVTEPAHLDAWFPQRIVGEWRVGAPLTFESRDGEFPPFGGEVLACEPPALLEFRWGPDVLRFEIVPNAEPATGCTFRLFDVFGELGKAARDAAGWHTCLDFLAHHLSGTEEPWTTGDRWGEVHPGYVERFGPAAATIGPPAGA